MNNKKSSSFFLPILVVIAFLVLINLYIVLIFKSAPLDFPIGKRQFDLLKTYAKAEKSLFYIDQSAKYSAQQALQQMAGEGILYEPKCGSFNGVNALVTITKKGANFYADECSLDDKSLNENFLKYFNDIFRNYIGNYPDAYIPGSYDYEIKNNELIGRAKENIVFQIVPEGFEVKPEITSTNPNDIYQQVSGGEIPSKLFVAMKSKIDIETIKQYHPEVWVQYTELCSRMGATTFGNPPGICKSLPVKCCITSGYRHPAYNKEKSGAANSPHQYGTALDIYIGKGKAEQLKWADAADDLFTRVGIYPSDTHIHVDLMPPKGEYKLRYWIGQGGTVLERANSFAELQSKATRFT